MADTLLSIPSSGIAGDTSAQSYTQYTYTYTATQAQTFVTFEFRQDPAYWGLDDISFASTGGGGNLLTNGGFESGGAGWTLIGVQGLPAAGTFATGTSGSGAHNSHSGTGYYYDGAVGGIDGIYQAVNTTIGQQYTVNFWLANDGDGPSLAQVQVGSNVYASVPADLTLDPASDTGVQGDNYTTNTQPTIDGTGFAGDTVTLYDGSTVIGTGTIGNNGNWSVTPSTVLSGGVHNLSATQTDGNGVVSNYSATLTITLPPAAPTIGLATPSDTGTVGDGITAISTPTITGTGTVGDTVTLFEGGNQVTTAIVAGDGTWSYTPSIPFADGVHHFTATDTDVHGNTSIPSTTFDVTVDTAAPSVPPAPALTSSSDSGVSGDGSTNVSAPTLVGSAEPGSTVTIYDGSNHLGTSVVGVNGGWSFTSGTLADGAHPITVTATDAAGNVSGGSQTFALTIDTVAPAVTAALLNDTGSSATDGVTSDGTLTGGGDPNATVTVSEGGMPIGTVVADAQGHWTFTPVGLVDGAHTLAVSETDAAGNTQSTPVAFVLNTQAVAAPSSLTLDPAADTGALGDGVTSVPTPSIVGTAVAGDVVKVYDGPTLLGTTTAGAQGNWSFATGLLADGVHQITATATDTVGNVSTTSQPLSLIIDTVAPAVTASLLNDTGASASDGLTSKPTLTGSGDPNAVVTISEGAATLGTATADAQGNWVFVPIGLADGAHILSASETDAAGNSRSAALAFVLDSTAPLPASGLGLTSASDTGTQGDGVTADTMPAFSGQASPGDKVTLLDGGVALGTASVQPDGSWSFSAGALADGPHQITAVVSDAAGNTSPISQAFALTVDTTPPAVTAGLLRDTGTSNTDGITYDPTITGGGDPNTPVTISEGNTVLGSVTADAQGRWTFAPQGLADGVHTLVASETDAAGNTTATPLTIRLDTAPAPDTITISPGLIGVARYFDTQTGNQFFSASATEANGIEASRPDLQMEGIQFYAFSPDVASGDPSAAPVYRFFDTTYGTHFFTADANERDAVIATRPDLTFEGVGFYEHTSEQPGDTAVYRFFNNDNGTHFYTSDANERASVIATRPDMQYEGIGFYAPHPV